MTLEEINKILNSALYSILVFLIGITIAVFILASLI